MKDFVPGISCSPTSMIKLMASFLDSTTSESSKKAPLPLTIRQERQYDLNRTAEMVNNVFIITLDYIDCEN